MTAKIVRTRSTWARLALALPLAALVPLAVPFDAAQVASFGLPQGLAALGSADAATVRKAKKRKVTVRKAPTTRKVCTTTKVKGRKVTKCKTVKIVAAPLVAAATTPLPLVTIAPPPVPVAYIAPPAPPPPALMPAAQVPAAAYFWIDQADSYANALGNSPPDFTFNCDGVDCWAWVSRSGEVLIVEPGRDGVVQYYFGPRATAPYLVRDSYYAYAFDGRDLTQIYDNQGRVYTGALTSGQRYASQDLQDRGRALFAASMRTRRWDGGAAIAWGSQFYDYGYNDGWNYGWQGAWREQRDWRRYHDERGWPPRRLEEERHHRRDARHNYDDWRRNGGHGAPPPTGNPVVTPGADSGGATPPVRGGPRPPHGGAPGGPPPPVPQQGPPPAPLPPVAEVPPPQVTPAPPSPLEPPRRRPPREVSEDAPVDDLTLPPGDTPVRAPPVRAPRAWTPAPPPPPAPVQYEAPQAAPAPVQYEAPQAVPAPPPPAPMQWQAPQVAPPPPPAPAPAVYVAPAPAPAPPPPPPPPPRDEFVTESSSGDSDRP